MVPQVIDRLVLLLRARPNLADASVLDGPEVSGNYKDVVILVGYNPDAHVDVTVTRNTRGLVPNVDEEFEVGVLINVVDGLGNVKAARDKAKAALDELAAVITTKDMSLDGTCDHIQLGPAMTWRTFPTPKGVESTLACSITGKALL